MVSQAVFQAVFQAKIFVLRLGPFSLTESLFREDLFLYNSSQDPRHPAVVEAPRVKRLLVL